MPNITVTHITTATVVLTIDGVVFLTDPTFCPAGTEFPVMPGFSLKTSIEPALSLAQLPAIDAVLLSHEDHPDNLDDEGRKLLDARHVFTTPDGAEKLAPRPAVVGLKDWETTEVWLQGKRWRITATPCVHLPGGECVGFILESDSLGRDSNGLPNAVWFTGDSIYLDAWKEKLSQWNIVLVLANLGAAKVPTPDGGALQVTMDARDAVKIVRELNVPVLVPLHYEGWGHFSQFGEELRNVLEAENVMDKICFVEPGVEKRVC
ncbi:beta-lactamase superfamily domain-containing protein [Mrakia frigida]|uniref:MBL fold metallo-hydrolase n=1 Tax=Mrakia frigida TaxID=29902 RepID=UPI003FCC1A1C